MYLHIVFAHTAPHVKLKADNNMLVLCLQHVSLAQRSANAALNAMMYNCSINPLSHI